MKVSAKTKTTTVLHGVTLTLDGQETKTLALLLFHVGGSPTDSRRGITDRMLKNLREVLPKEINDEVAYPNSNKYFYKTDSSIYFADEKEIK